MLVSVNWLREFLEADVTAEEVAELLTRGAFPVESVTPAGSALERMVVAEIHALQPHPQAERLTLCRVTTGAEDYRIVCGATNMRVGDRVALALPGAHLADGTTIRRATFRGVSSDGMLLSEKEIAVGDEAEGIIRLPAEAPVGASLGSVLGLPDAVLDVGVTPNRPDCLSHVGIAREVAALTAAKLRLPEVTLDEQGSDIASLVRVVVEDADLCPRYVARIVQGVRIGPSPLPLRIRLRACGVRPINTVVDATNYVMLEWGQPLHAFDLNLLDDRTILVRRADEDEDVVTLDGEARRLTREMLTIRDGHRAVAVAGVMGARNTEVNEATTDVLVEAATFDPTSIRRTRTRLRVTTEASLRFERGVDGAAPLPVSGHAVALMQRLAGGTIARGALAIDPRPAVPRRLTLRPERVRRILGMNVAADAMQDLLGRLGYAAAPDGPGRLAVTVPTCRVDVAEEIDLIEDVARLLGYSEVPTDLPTARATVGLTDPLTRIEETVRVTLVALGFAEAVTSAFCAPALAEQFAARPAVLANPLAQEEAALRPSLLVGLLLAARRNRARDRLDGRLFEVGSVFAVGAPYAERRGVAAVAYGTRATGPWESGPVDVHDMVGVVENVCDALGVRGAWCAPPVAGALPFLHPGQGAEVRVGTDGVGWIGALHPHMLAAIDMSPGPCVAMELDLDALAARVPAVVSVTPVPRVPGAKRDVAVVVDVTVPARTVAEVIRAAAGPYVDRVDLFDVYAGDPVPPGKKSLAFALRWQAPDRTLTDEEIVAAVTRVWEALGALGGMPRGEQQGRPPQQGEGR